MEALGRHLKRVDASALFFAISSVFARVAMPSCGSQFIALICGSTISESLCSGIDAGDLRVLR